MGFIKKNVGITDRIIRFVLVDLLLGASFLGIDMPAIIMNIAFVISLMLIVTIVIGYSPVYHVMGINTKEEKVEESEKSEVRE